MCPSFRVTREEEHSTRGRAHLLFEMMRGEVITDGWKSREVRDALDLCLSCKGCKKDCPVGVDVATYKAEFLSHYYAGRLRPRSAYAFGLIPWWTRLASFSPGLANLFTQTPGLAALSRRLAGAAPNRSFPPFASQSFRSWFRNRPAPSADRPAPSRVLLFPDTFNNHFHPGTARAAVEVLEAAGFSVSIPRRRLCCGRPLYDYGMLGLARAFLRETLDELAEDLAAGTPVVVLEPSCAAVFRDELPELFPDDEDAGRLRRQTLLLSEILSRNTVGWIPGRLSGRAIVQTHCHQKSVLGVSEGNDLLSSLELQISEPEEGCCGMAGAFGFEAEHRDLSLAIGEQTLLPAVRGARSDTLIVADGFSCREQIRQATGRGALHLAQVLQLASHRSSEPLGPFPEAVFREGPARVRPGEVAGAVVAGAGAAALWLAARRRSR
jgi:Fe-S oxidoreductase